MPVDTVHGLFRLQCDAAQSARAILDLILMDEFVQLGGVLLQACLSAWNTAGRLPVVGGFGDWLQLQGIDDAGHIGHCHCR